MPELRLVVLALQDRLAYGPTFESAMAALFGGQSSSLTGAAAMSEPGKAATIASNSTDRSAMITRAAQDLADYQRLTAEGKLAAAGQKLEDLKRTLVQFQADRK